MYIDQHFSGPVLRMFTIRLYLKLLLREFFAIPSFCKSCGVNVRDFSAKDEVWQQIEPHIKYGHVLCYNCFCDICAKLKLSSVWRLEPLE
jgi:hypothetical protein